MRLRLRGRGGASRKGWLELESGFGGASFTPKRAAGSTLLAGSRHGRAPLTHTVGVPAEKRARGASRKTACPCIRPLSETASKQWGAHERLDRARARRAVARALPRVVRRIAAHCAARRGIRAR